MRQVVDFGGPANPLDAVLPKYMSADKAMVWSWFTDALAQVHVASVIGELEVFSSGDDPDLVYEFPLRCAEVVVWLCRAGERGAAAALVAKIWWQVRGAQSEAGHGLWSLKALLEQLSRGFPGLEDGWSDADRAELVDLVRELVVD